MKLSVGRRGLNALQKERGEMYSPICIYSPHHISTAMNEALTQAPPVLPGSQSQNLSQHVFYTMQRKLFLGFAPSRTLGEDRVCLHTAAARRASESLKEKERRVAFLRNLASNVVLLSVLHVVWSSFYMMFAKFVLLLFPDHGFVLIWFDCRCDADGV